MLGTRFPVASPEELPESLYISLHGERLDDPTLGEADDVATASQHQFDVMGDDENGGSESTHATQSLCHLGHSAEI